MSAIRERGMVLWFHEARGFGFIVSRTDDVQVFVSHRDLPGRHFRWLKAGDEVVFTRTIDVHGAIATDVIACNTSASGAIESHLM